MKHLFELAAAWAVPLLFAGIPLYGYLKGIKVYEVFVRGAKEGFEVGVRIIPFLVAILAAVRAFQASGALGALSHAVGGWTNRVGLPPEVLPMVLVRPLSGGGALGVLSGILRQSGPDSYAGHLASVMMGSTETTFYVLAVYCGAVGVTRYRHALWAALTADAAGMVAAVLLCRWLWG